MKNSSSNMREVPRIHPGCSMAETGYNDYDDFDNPLRPLDIIPEDRKGKVLSEEKTQEKGYDGYYVDKKLELLPEFTKPSSVREEQYVTILIPSSGGVDFVTLFGGINFKKAWVFMNEDVVEELRKHPYKYHNKTVAYGEIFRLEDNDTFWLQDVKYFDGWKVLLKCEINGEVFHRLEKPEFIIQFEMMK